MSRATGGGALLPTRGPRRSRWLDHRVTTPRRRARTGVVATNCSAQEPDKHLRPDRLQPREPKPIAASNPPVTCRTPLPDSPPPSPQNNGGSTDTFASKPPARRSTRSTPRATRSVPARTSAVSYGRRAPAATSALFEFGAAITPDDTVNLGAVSHEHLAAERSEHDQRRLHDDGEPKRTGNSGALRIRAGPPWRSTRRR